MRLNPSFICNGVGGGCEFLLAPLKLTTDHLFGIANPLLNQYPVLCLQSLDLDIELQCWELYSQCPFAVYRSLCPCANSPGWMGVHVWFKVSKTCSKCLFRMLPNYLTVYWQGKPAQTQLQQAWLLTTMTSLSSQWQMWCALWVCVCVCGCIKWKCIYSCCERWHIVLYTCLISL